VPTPLLLPPVKFGKDEEMMNKKIKKRKNNN
jgi:hypothetical protein